MRRRTALPLVLCLLDAALPGRSGITRHLSRSAADQYAAEGYTAGLGR